MRLRHIVTIVALIAIVGTLFSVARYIKDNARECNVTQHTPKGDGFVGISEGSGCDMTQTP